MPERVDVLLPSDITLLRAFHRGEQVGDREDGTVRECTYRPTTQPYHWAAWMAGFEWARREYFIAEPKEELACETDRARL